MKTTRCLTLLVLTLAIPAARAESVPPVSVPVRQELRDAGQAATQSFEAAEKRRELQDLTQARDRWARELAEARTNLANAQSELAKARAAGRQDAVEGSNREVAGWLARVNTASAKLKALDERARTAEQTAQAAPVGEPESDLLVAGDILELVVVEDSSFNGMYPIRRGGYILIPRVGRVFVAGKDLEGAERAIQETLQKNQILTEAKVIAERAQGNLAMASPVIFLAGEFEKPGPWQIPPGSVPTLLTTILQSGGTTENADLSQVRLLRLVGGQQMVVNFDVKSMLAGTNFSSDTPLKPNDIVVVSGRANEVYVTGNVKTPGTLKLVPSEELKAYSAILKSGGFARFADEKKVYILRDTGTGAKERIPVNIKEIKKGSAADVKLQNRDIVVVPERFFSL
jgi:protein involved in polysaccharide export with SLBB domain